MDAAVVWTVQFDVVLAGEALQLGVMGLETVSDPLRPRPRGRAWTIRSLHGQPLEGLKYLVPGLPWLAVEHDEVVAHDGRSLSTPCDSALWVRRSGLGRCACLASPPIGGCHGVGLPSSRSHDPVPQAFQAGGVPMVGPTPCAPLG